MDNEIISLYSKAVETNFTDENFLNLIAAYYLSQDKKYVAMLCYLASLLANSSQRTIYNAAEDLYLNGILEPPKFIFSETPKTKISVIISTYNRPDLLKTAIKSVLDQTFQDFELIVVNNNGTEETKNVIDSFNSGKIRYIFEPKQGRYYANNAAIKVSRGEYIVYLDDDDIFFPNHLETLFSRIYSSQADIIYGRNRWVIGKWVNNEWVELKDLTDNSKYEQNRIYTSCIIANQNVMHHRRIIEKIGLYQEQPERGSDWEFHVRCARNYPHIERINQVTSEVRVPDVIPSSNPERSQFYSILWPLFFRSGFGEATLGIAAWQNKDKKKSIQHLSKLGQDWQFLHKRTLDGLWNLAIGSHEFFELFPWDIIDEYHPLWLAKKMHTSKGLSIRKYIPASVQIDVMKKSASYLTNKIINP